MQYDQLQEGMSFLRDPSTLTLYDPDVLRLSLTLAPRYPEDIEEALCATRLELAGAQSALAAARSQSDAMRSEIGRASTHIEHVTAQLTQARVELRARDAENAALRRSLELIEAMGREIETASKHIEHVTATLARTREEVRARDIEAASLHRSVEQLTTELDAGAAHIRRLTRERDAFQQSLSWRWTAPARALFRMFKGS